ncbi:TetR/AcrR family transcriptional regulator [Clostridium tarantellae]|uniref:TetR family transcriptional regulator n=1 Tax=Clostridium tarantellae TaxID=39493 RepID=A0A6I1MK43_9CLOT|nr:TetR/AcrR family transcriptional regulator [Clostridium tarantellae]MPQ43390.1 TetR family transcriptional regulator [Clostridium tarantellae]
MPKIIKNLEEKIFKEASKIFIHKGFDNTDMKTIAEACGIAVGTLYNYYPNKKTLYVQVFRRSWEDTLKKLNKISQIKEQQANLVLKKMIEVLYNDTELRDGLGDDVRTLHTKGELDWKIIQEYFFKSIYETLKIFKFKEEFGKYPEVVKKIVLIWFAMEISLMKVFPNSKEENINLIYNTMKGYIIY